MLAWYSPSGKEGNGLKVWARTQQYKLYRDGKFFDVSKDRLEKTPIQSKGMSEEERAIKTKLQKVIDDRREQVGR